MAENTIDNLSIQVTASADNAARVFDRLASSAGRLRGAAQGATGGMQDMAQGARDAGAATQEAGTQSGKARPNIKGVGKDAKDAGDNAKKGSSGLATFWQSLKRIAYYRMIRSIIKGISQAFREGAQNLYQWSKGTGLSDFSKNLDRIATSALYLKNSLGAMLEPIIRVLTPIIETVVDGLVWIINHVNMLFAALSGSQTYTVAKKIATTWGDAADDVASSTHKAAEDIRRTLLGFDEINRLDKPNSGSGSGGYGGNNNNNNFNDMFETRQLDGWMAALAKFIDDFNLQIPATIATIVAGFETIKLAIKAVSDLSLGWLKDMAGKTIEVAVSLVRSGWETIKGWAVSFGEAVVDLAVRVKTKIADLWASIVTAWNALNPVLQVGIVIGVTAAALWAAYQLAWQLVPDKMLEVEAVIKTTASTLKNQIVDAWAALGSWFLGVKLAVATTADGLKSSIVDSWGKLSAWFLSVKIAVATTAEGLKSSVVDAWGKLSAWFLSVKVAVATTAEGLKSSIVDAWAKLSAWYLSVKLAVATTAEGLKSSVVDAWGKLSAWYLSVKLAVATTAEGLKSSIVNAWGKLSAWYLGVKLAVATTAEGLKSSIVNAWGKLPAWFLSVKLAISTTAEGLKTSVVTAWNKLTAWSLDVVISSADKIKTAVNNVWGWVKDNWEIVAAGALGIAVAIATPWGTLAAALSGLWADVMASFGGALSFGILPTLGKAEGVTVPFKKVEAIPLEVPLEELLKVNDPTIDATVNAVPGDGFKETLGENKFDLGGIEDASVLVSLQRGWLGTPEAELGVDNLQGTVTMSLGKEKDWANNGWQKVLGLKDKTAKITTSLKKVKDWKEKGLKEYLGISDKSTTITAKLDKKWGTQSPIDYLKLSGLSTTIKVGLKADDSKIKMRVKQGTATLISATKRTENKETRTALGGVFSNGRWSRIPQYANGTTNAHGSLFLAGEAGPEIVGHVGGRTEVLNKSQLASAMYSAVQAAMAPAAANFAAAAQSMGVSNVGVDMETLAEMVRQGVEQAMGRSNEYDRQKVELLRSINEKDYQPEISTSSINKAQQRMNRRAGTTIVPVGT